MKQGRWRALALLTFARVSMGFQFQSAASVSPFLAREFGLDNAQIGLLIGLYLLPGIAIALPGGLLGARFGDRRVVAFGLALMVLGGAWLAVASDYPSACLARLVSGVGAVLLNVLLTNMAADWFEERERVLAMSVLVNAWPIGIGLALITLGALAQAYSTGMALGASALLAAAGLAALLAAYRDPADVLRPAAPLGLGALSGRQWRLLVLASLPWMLFNGAYVVLLAFLPLYLLRAENFSVAAAGGVMALNTVLVIASVQVGGILAKRTGRPDRVAMIGLLLGAVAMVALLGLAWPILWIALAGLVLGLPAGVLVTLPTEVLRPEVRAQGLGFFYTVYYAGNAVFPPAAGWLADRAGSASAPLWLAVATVLVTALTLAAFRARQRSRSA